MRPSTLAHLRCPKCRGELALHKRSGPGSEIVEGRVVCPCGRTFPIRDGVPDFIDPDTLHPSDLLFQRKYDEGASDYDRGIEWLFSSFLENEDSVRSQMADLLEIEPGQQILEVGCGTGRDSQRILRRLGGKGGMYVLELSPGMIQIARENMTGAKIPVEYFLADASCLPFADARFDAVFHFGGINAFGDKRRALAEMTRVVRTGGKVVVGDESVAPWLRRMLFGRILMKVNPLYKHRPPLSALPANAERVCLRWILGNAFYVIDYRVGDAPPRLDLDLPIPGKRGGTLRSRYWSRSQ